MGVTASFYATEGDIINVEAALKSIWPEEVGELYARERVDGSAVDSIYGNDDGVELVLWQDGRFTAFAESELCLFEEDALARLSTKTGTVVAVCIGDHGGSYILDVYREGQLVRSFNNERAPVGIPIAEEQGADLSNFSGSEVEKIWSAFGLKDYFEGVPPFRVFSRKDTDRQAEQGPLRSPEPEEEHRPKQSTTSHPASGARPWWRFW